MHWDLLRKMDHLCTIQPMSVFPLSRYDNARMRLFKLTRNVHSVDALPPTVIRRLAHLHTQWSTKQGLIFDQSSKQIYFASLALFTPTL